MNTAAIAWCREHWRPLGVVALVAAAFLLGRRTAPKPSVALAQDTAVQATSTAQTETTKETGPTVTTVDETEYAPPVGTQCPDTQLVPVPMPGPVRVVRHTVIEQGPAVERTQVVERLQEQQEQHVSLQVSPPATPPRWALGAAVEDPLANKRLQLMLGFRVVGPIWLRASVTPARGAPSATVGAEIQF